MARRKAEPEGWSNSDTSRVVLNQRIVPGDQSFEGETGSAESGEHRIPGVPWVVLDQRVGLVDQSFVRSANGAPRSGGRQGERSPPMRRSASRAGQGRGRD